MKRYLVSLAAITASVIAVSGANAADMKKVAIASFGPHGSLTQVIEGFKAGLKDKGFEDGKTISYEYSDANFDPSLLPQVLTKLEAIKPDLMLTVTTPVTQASVKIVRDQALPIVFAPVTDPVAAGLVPDWNHGSARYVGASTMQSTETVIEFAEKLLGKPIKSFGILYNPGDANDVAGKALAEVAAKTKGIQLKSVSVDAVNDIAARTAALNGVDFIYAIPSSMLMPALAAIASNADRMGIPIVSSSPEGVQENVVLASMSVAWAKVGYNAGVLGAQILQGKKPSELANYKATPADHSPLISGKRLKATGKELPASLADCKCVI